MLDILFYTTLALSILIPFIGLGLLIFKNIDIEFFKYLYIGLVFLVLSIVIAIIEQGGL